MVVGGRRSWKDKDENVALTQILFPNIVKYEHTHTYTDRKVHTFTHMHAGTRTHRPQGMTERFRENDKARKRRSEERTKKMT